MAVSPHNPVLQTNLKSEEGDSATNCNLLRPTESNANHNNEDCKDTSGATPTVVEENNNLNITGTVSTVNAIVDVQSEPVNSSQLINEVDLASSPQNTVGLPCSVNRTELSSTNQSLNDQNTSSCHLPPALPPRPANLQVPIIVNGLPHPPHAFNASQGKFVIILLCFHLS